MDPAFRRHLARARHAGLLVGAYHFYDYRSDGAAQADHFIDTLDAAGALSDTLPPIVDIECFEPFGSADQSYARHELRAFADRVFERTGRLPMVYTSGLMWRAVTGGAEDFGDLPLWIACWRCASPELPAGWHDWLFWQTGSTVLDGTGDRIGSDRFAGDADELRALATDFRVAGGRRATADRDVRVPLRAPRRPRGAAVAGPGDLDRLAPDARLRDHPPARPTMGAIGCGSGHARRTGCAAPCRPMPSCSIGHDRVSTHRSSRSDRSTRTPTMGPWSLW